MDNDSYTLIEAPFRTAARPLLDSLRATLLDGGLGPFTEVQDVDRDIERGLGFGSVDSADQFVDLMLTDNECHGAEGVGLILTCSIYGSGQVWAPGNFTDAFSMSSAEEVLDRLKQFDADEIAGRISLEWERMAAMQDQRNAMRGS